MSGLPSAQARRPDVPAVEIEGLVKAFPVRRTLRQLVRTPFRRAEKLQALRGVDLRVRQGEFFGLLGPNGAGKTTLLKVLCGLVLPDEGAARVLGVTVGQQSLHRVIGLVHGDERSFYWRLTARENLEFFARLYMMDRATRKKRVDELLERVNLARDADRRFSDFSSGMKQRVVIARALLADPPVLLMDEPTRSLDPVNASSLRRWIQQELFENEGKTIVLATHNLNEAEQLCDRVAVLAGGQVRALNTPQELRRQGAAGLVYRFRLDGEVPSALEGAEIVQSTRDGSFVEATVRIGTERQLDGVIQALRARGATILGCEPAQPELEKVFEQIVAKSEDEDRSEKGSDDEARS